MRESISHGIMPWVEVVGKALYRRSKSRPMILPVVTEL
jgi:hypothetical protein